MNVSSYLAKIWCMTSAGSTRYGHVASVLRAQIRAGRYQVGDELPPIATLVDTFNVSHMTAKEALRLLREQGVISTARGARARVLAVPLQDEEPVADQLRAIRDRLDQLEARAAALERHGFKRTSQDKQ